jgi:hypothetical protein
LIQALADAEGGELPDGRLVTFMETKRAAHSVAESKYRQLRLRGAKGR